MKRLVIPESPKSIKKISSSDCKDIIFSINPEKKGKLEAIAVQKSSKVIKILREWIEKDDLLHELLKPSKVEF